jgi:hypothetical protein
MRRQLPVGAGLFALCLMGLAVAQQQSGQTSTGNGSNQPPPPPRCQPPNPIMTALDTDKDGKLSAEEIANAATALAGLDTNGDGTLSADELRPARPEGAKDGQARNGQAPKPGDQIMRLDTDGNGYVTLEEFSAPMKEMFTKIDTNKDNQIDATEAAAAPPPPCGRGPRGGMRPGQDQDAPPPPPPPPAESEDTSGTQTETQTE